MAQTKFMIALRLLSRIAVIRIAALDRPSCQGQRSLEGDALMTQRWLTGLLCVSIGAALTGLVPHGAWGDETQKANQAPAVPKSLIQPASSAPAASCDGSCSLPLPKNSGEPAYSVVSPLGDPTVKMITMAPRLDTLAGKTVCLVWNHTFKADITLPAIGEALKKKYPDIRIIPYTEIDAAVRAAGGERPWTEPAILQAVLKKKGCNVVISGNGVPGGPGGRIEPRDAAGISAEPRGGAWVS